MKTGLRKISDTTKYQIMKKFLCHANSFLCKPRKHSQWNSDSRFNMINFEVISDLTVETFDSYQWNRSLSLGCKTHLIRPSKTVSVFFLQSTFFLSLWLTFCWTFNERQENSTKRPQDYDRNLKCYFTHVAEVVSAGF